MGNTPPFASIQLRRGLETDLNALVALEAAVFGGDRLSRRQLRHHLRAPSTVLLVATNDQTLLGYAMLLCRRGSAKGRIYSIAVSAAARGQQLGAQLLNALEAAAVARRLIELRLEVRVDNAAAIALYLRRGYQEFARRLGYYEDGADALRMRKDLAKVDGSQTD